LWPGANHVPREQAPLSPPSPAILSRRHYTHMTTAPRFFRWLLLAVLLVAGFPAASDTPAPPPKSSDVVGVWGGYSNHNDFLRLEIDKDGSGFLSFVSDVRDAPVGVYRVRKWTLSNWSLALELEPLTRDAEPFQFQRVRIGYTEMECEFAGKGWDRKATLFSERDLRDLSKRAQKAIIKERRKKR
jgi:hypothetical protein